MLEMLDVVASASRSIGSQNEERRPERPLGKLMQPAVCGRTAGEEARRQGGHITHTATHTPHMQAHTTQAGTHRHTHTFYVKARPKLSICVTPQVSYNLI